MSTTETKTTELVPSNGEMRSPIAAGNRGLELRSIDDFYRFAKYLAASGFAPKGMERPESILVALQMGAELGLSPMAAVQNIAVINGRPAVWGDAMLAVARASGVFDEAAFEEVVEDTGKGGLLARCTVRRAPHGKPTVRVFTMDDAKLAGLAGKSGPWQQYPRRMLQMRARSWALRDAFSDVLRGIPVAEEVMDCEAISVESRPSVQPRVSLSPLNQTLQAKLGVEERDEPEQEASVEDLFSLGK